VGRAAQSGLLAARLAANGLTASPDALEHRSGMLRAFSPAGQCRVDGEIAAGRDWHIVKNGLNIKRYPVCYALHRSIDGLLALTSKQKLKAENIREIELIVGRLQANMLRHSRPQTGLDAKFSAEFAAASAVSAGRVGLAELTDGFVRTPAIQGLLPKVKVTPVDDPDPDDPLFSRSDAVRVTLADGTVLAGPPVVHAKGHARNPVSLEELRGKFDDCVGASLDPSARARLFERLASLEKLPHAGDLYT
jgi:aconitate decarboxylase